MTAPSPTAPASLPLPTRLPLAARLPLLGLYPAKYRAAHGEEIAAVFAEATEDAGTGTALREWAHLAAHALRLRTRLSSANPAGRIAAGAAPFILAGGAALSMVHLLFGVFLSDRFEIEGLGHFAFRALTVAQASPWILALVFAAVGRWTPARIMVLLGILGWAGPALAFTPHSNLAIAPYILLTWSGPELAFGPHPELAFGPHPELASSVLYTLLLPSGLVSATLLLIAPPDAVDLSPRGRKHIVLTALALAVPMSTLAICLVDPVLMMPTAFYSPTVQLLLYACTNWPAAVMSLALLLHLGSPRPDRLRAAGIALAAIPWTTMLYPPSYWSGPASIYNLLYNGGVVLVFLATATLLAVLRHFLRRSRPTDPPGLA